jgi:hypothetical protein
MELGIAGTAADCTCAGHDPARHRDRTERPFRQGTLRGPAADRGSSGQPTTVLTGTAEVGGTW